MLRVSRRFKVSDKWVKQNFEEDIALAGTKKKLEENIFSKNLFRKEIKSEKKPYKLPWHRQLSKNSKTGYEIEQAIKEVPSNVKKGGISFTTLRLKKYLRAVQSAMFRTVLICLLPTMCVCFAHLNPWYTIDEHLMSQSRWKLARLKSHVESLKEAEQEQITSMRALCEKKNITLEIKTTSEKLRENEALEISPEFHPINIVIGQQTPEDLAAKTGYKLGVQ